MIPRYKIVGRIDHMNWTGINGIELWGARIAQSVARLASD